MNYMALCCSNLSSKSSGDITSNLDVVLVGAYIETPSCFIQESDVIIGHLVGQLLTL